MHNHALENREIFKRIVEEVGAESARSVVCHTLDECLAAWPVTLSAELNQAIDALRWQHRDPAQ